ncbi:unnamed protein product [Rhodiola kirilowii]
MSSSKVRNPDAANGAKVCEAQAPSIDVNPHNQQQQQKKKARRRLHRSRPYQDRLLNMAEARKEIVTALKFHRASMKQQQQQQLVQPAAAPDLEAKSDSGSIFSTSNLVDNLPQSLPFTCDFEANLPFWVPPPASHNSTFSFSLPNQTLGLNLNFQNFTNFNISPSSSSSSSALSSTTTAEEIHSDSRNSAFFVSHPAVNMAVMDTSAWCSNPAESSLVEFELGEGEHLFTEIPSWLNPTDCYLQHHLNSPCPHDPLPWMDIEEIEGMDGDWLA